MKTIKSISLDTDITLSPMYAELTKGKKLSKLINESLRVSLNIKEINKDTAKIELERRLNELNSEKAVLSDQLNNIKADEDKWLLEHPSVKMWVCGICKAKNHMSISRCGGCQMPSRDDKGTVTEEVFLK